jgi:hypothetical protein
MNLSLGPDYLLKDIPNRLARFREPAFLVQNNTRIFHGENIETNEDVEVVQNGLQWRRQFEDHSRVFEDVKENQLCFSNLPVSFNMSLFRENLIKEFELPFRLVQSEYNIFGEICSFKLDFDTPKQAKIIENNLALLKMGQMRVFSKKTARENITANRTVVFMNLPESVSDREFITRLSQRVNVTKFSCPKVYSEGTLPRTSELIEYLKSERPKELEEHNVYIMEFGVQGWRRLKFDLETCYSALNFDAFMKDSVDSFEEEVDAYKSNVAKNFKSYFKFLEKEINKKTYFSIEDPTNFENEIKVKDFEKDLEYMKRSAFHDEDNFLENLKIKSIDSDNTQKPSTSLKGDFNDLKSQVLSYIQKSSQSDSSKGILADLLNPFLNELSSGQLETLLTDLKKEHTSEEYSDLQQLFENRNFDQPLLQRAEAHKGFIVVQFASEQEAKKGVLLANMEIERDLHPLLLNDMGLHHLDPDFKARKFKEIYNLDRQGKDLRKEFVNELQTNLEKVRRKEFMNKISQGDTLEGDHWDYKLGEEHSNLEHIDSSSISPRERMIKMKRNRIRDRDIIRKEFRALFDKISFFCINDSADFTYNLAGFETIASKMMERGRKVDGSKGNGVREVKFKEELQMIKERRQNYLSDSNNDTEQRRQVLRGDIREVQDKMASFEYQDVREELDIVLGEYGLSDLQKQSFEEMMLLNADLRDLLDGSHSVPDRIFQKVDKTRTLTESSRVLKSVSMKFFSRSINDMKEAFFREMRDAEGPSHQAERELRKFEKELQYIFFGKILESSVVQDFLQDYFEQMKNDPFDIGNNYFHMYKMDDSRFLEQSEQGAIITELYGEKEGFNKLKELVQQKERESVGQEYFVDRTYSNLKLKRRMQEFELRDGLPVGLLKLKEDVQVDSVETQELVDLLNYNDLDYQYEPFLDEVQNLYLIKKARGFRFNVAKFLYYTEEKHKMASEICKLVGVSFDDYLRMELGLPLYSEATREYVTENLLKNPDFVEGLEDLKHEFFSEEEIARIWGLSQDVIDHEILVYKAHMSMKNRIGKMSEDFFTKPVQRKDLVLGASGKIPETRFNVLVEN